MILRVKNWREFQHYSKRNPPWIKLHHKLLDNRAFLQLPVASRALVPLLWLLASERDGVIPDAINEITYRLRMAELEVRDALAPLIAGEFITCEHDARIDASACASAPIAEPLTQESKAEETKAPTGLSEDSSVETSCPVAAREAGPGGADAHDSNPVIPLNFKRIPS